MPSTVILPEAEQIRAIVDRLIRTPRSTRQVIYNMPMHYPAAVVEQFMKVALSLSGIAERQAQELAAYKAYEQARLEEWARELDEEQEREDDRQFLLACALEHRAGSFE